MIGLKKTDQIELNRSFKLNSGKNPVYTLKNRFRCENVYCVHGNIKITRKSIKILP